LRRPNSTSTTYGYDAVSRLASLAHDVPNNEIGGGVYGGASALARQEWLGLGLDVAGFIPGANDIVTVAHLSYDAYRTWKRTVACP
jgi:hypothetical protein